MSEKSLKRYNVNKVIQSKLKYVYEIQVKMLDDKTRAYQKLVEKFINIFRLYCLQNCPIFKLLFLKIYKTGSAFEGLKVKNPDEFDINIVLKLPFDFLMEVQEVDYPPSFACVKLVKPFNTCIQYGKDGQKFACLSHFFDHNQYLVGKNILNWMQSLIDKLCSSEVLKEEMSDFEIRCTNSGPARTPKLRIGEEWISIDLVPVFEVNSQAFSKLQHLNCEVLPGEKQELTNSCFLVPKPFKDYFDNLDEVNVSRLWRVHFAYAEKELLKGRHTLKTVIKLVKRLRDLEQWNLPSYFIKTVAFWIVVKNPDTKYFEKESYLGLHFIEMLEHLCNCFINRNLSQLFYPDCNLLRRLNPEYVDAMRRRLGKILAELHRNPLSIVTIFQLGHHYLEDKSPPKQKKNKVKILKGSKNTKECG